MNDFRFYKDPDNDNHFILKNALLIPSYNLYVKDSDYQGYASYGVYVNASTYDNCGYTLVERQGNPCISVNERGLYDVHFNLNAEDGNYITFVPKNYYLVGTFNNWTPSKSYSLSLEDKNTLKNNSQLRIVYLAKVLFKNEDGHEGEVTRYLLEKIFRKR